MASWRPSPRAADRRLGDPAGLLPAEEADEGRPTRSRCSSNPANLIKDTVTIPEGLRVTDIVGILADNTDFKRGGVREGARRSPTASACPATRRATPRATSSRRPTTSARTRRPRSILQDMVDRWKQAADDADLEGAAAQLGYTPRGADDGRQPRRGRGPRRRHAEDRPGDLQPARGRRDQRPAPDRRHDQLRRRQRPDGRADHLGHADRLAVQHLPERRAAADPDRGTRATTRCTRPRTRPTATGTTTSRSTSRPARPSSPRPTTSSSSTRTSCGSTARPSPRAPAEPMAAVHRHCAVLGDPIAHSLSPVLHRAGYAAVGLDWEYDAGAGRRGRARRRSWAASTRAGGACR